MEVIMTRNQLNVIETLQRLGYQEAASIAERCYESGVDFLPDESVRVSLGVAQLIDSANWEQSLAYPNVQSIGVPKGQQLILVESEDTALDDRKSAVA
jgi:hypothetical protein